MGRGFNQLVIKNSKQYRIIGKGRVKGTYDIATVSNGKTIILTNVSNKCIRKSRAKEETK